MAPKWVVYALAGTYWRIFGNPQNGINCFKWALESVPSNYEDVVLTNLAGLLYKSGALDDALQGYNLKILQSWDCFVVSEVEWVRVFEWK